MVRERMAEVRERMAEVRDMMDVGDDGCATAL